MKEVGKAYYIQEIELAVLLSLAGQKELYGYPLHQVSGLSRMKLHQVLFDMTGRGMLCAEDERLCISGEWQELVQWIAWAGLLIVSADARREYSELFAYVSDRIVVLHTQWEGSGVIRMECWNPAELSERILQYGIRPERISWNLLRPEAGEWPDGAEPLQCIAEELFGKQLPAILDRKGVVSAVVCHDVRQRRKKEQIVVLNQGLDDYMTVSDGERSRVYWYSDVRMAETIAGWIGGMEI